MKILYGVTGEGMGHAMRSQVVLDHLVSSGHHVQIMASSRAADHLSKHFDGVNRIHGFHIIYDENRMRMDRTVWSNILEGNDALPDQIAAYFDLISHFRPEVVVSDFESWTYLYGRANGIPVFSVDNMQIINRCWQPREMIGGDRTLFEVTRAVVKSKLPWSSHYFVTTFFYPEVRKERTTLHPPILRPVILETEPVRGEHLLVYQTAEGHGDLVRALHESGMECRIYGMRRDLDGEVVEGDLRHRPFSPTTFIEDMASARAVIAGGGFTTLGECVYLGKPVLSIPVRGQFEQILNARWLEREGYGRYAPVADGPAVVEFLRGVPRYEENLASWSQDGNAHLFAALDEKLDEAAAGLIGPLARIKVLLRS